MGTHAHHEHQVEVDPQIARSLWTSLGLFALVVLVASVPISTWLAAWMASSSGPDALDGDTPAG
jgi:hypothetical protein